MLNMQEFETWLAINYNDSICLVAKDEDKIYWNGGPSYCDFDKSNMYVLKTYSANLDNYEKSVDSIELEFYRDFPPQAEIRESGGWLAPSGKFYPARYCEHSIKAEAIYKSIYQDLDYCEYSSFLEKHGYAHISDDGIMSIFDSKECLTKGTLTQSQLDTLFDIYQIAEDDRYKANIMKALNNHA